GEDVAAVVLAQPAAAAVVEERVPLVPGAVGVPVLQPADERERRALVASRGAELQRGVVVEQLGALADAAQRVAVAHDGAAAEAADGESRCGRAELDRRAAVRARRAVAALRAGFGGHGGAPEARPASS